MRDDLNILTSKSYCSFLMPYFLLNFSILPAVSSNFCLPVKKGWQAEQISTLRSPAVERVVKLLPHAQVTVTSSYLG